MPTGRVMAPTPGPLRRRRTTAMRGRWRCAALAAAGAPVRLDVLGLGRVAVVGGLVDFGMEEEEEEGEGLAAGVVEEGEVVAVEEAERKAAVDASSLSRRIL